MAGTIQPINLLAGGTSLRGAVASVVFPSRLGLSYRYFSYCTAKTRLTFTAIYFHSDQNIDLKV